MIPIPHVPYRMRLKGLYRHALLTALAPGKHGETCKGDISSLEARLASKVRDSREVFLPPMLDGRPSTLYMMISDGEVADETGIWFKAVGHKKNKAGLTHKDLPDRYPKMMIYLWQAPRKRPNDTGRMVYAATFEGIVQLRDMYWRPAPEFSREDRRGRVRIRRRCFPLMVDRPGVEYHLHDYRRADKLEDLSEALQRSHQAQFCWMVDCLYDRIRKNSPGPVREEREE